MFFKSKLLYGAIEATEDTAPVFVAADAVQTRNLSISVYQGSQVSLDIDRDSLGGQASINTSPHNTFSFETFAAGAGTAGTVPAWGKFLRACGMREVVNAGTDVQYDPAAGDFESMALEMRRPVPETGNHQRIVSTGARGEWGLDISKGQLPAFKFSNLLGSWYEPDEVAPIVPDTSAYKEPVPATRDNTPRIEIDGLSVVLESFSYNAGNQISRRDVPGDRRTILGDRDGKGSITILAPNLVDRNFFTDIQSHRGISTLPIEIEHGYTAGNILVTRVNQAQLSNIQEVDVDGELGYSMDFSALPSDAGNDEILITVK